MLEDQEWELVAPLLVDMVAKLNQRVWEGRHSLLEATRMCGQPALDMYNEITGETETNPNALYHHRISLHGPACQSCGRPL
jgi:hypothetical protein